MTLCYVVKDGRILLGRKKMGLGTGRWNGFGGKVEPGESIEEAAAREVREESGVSVADLKRHGVLEFYINEFPQDIEVHIFMSGSLSGTTIETDEMQPQWFALNQLPFDEMWEDDRYWMPLFLDGKKFRGNFHFTADHRLRHFSLRLVDTLQYSYHEQSQANR